MKEYNSLASEELPTELSYIQERGACAKLNEYQKKVSCPFKLYYF